MSEKFSLGFDILTRDQIEASITGNPFVEKNRLIMRLDMAARSAELKAKLQSAPDWDLVVCDEAHRMAASYFGGEVKETQRYKLGKLLGTRTRNLLLMSATPHNGPSGATFIVSRHRTATYNSVPRGMGEKGARRSGRISTSQLTNWWSPLGRRSSHLAAPLRRGFLLRPRNHAHSVRMDRLLPRLSSGSALQQHSCLLAKPS
jgi:hypothetical protein